MVAQHKVRWHDANKPLVWVHQYRADFYKGGTLWSAEYSRNATFLNKKRLDELKQYLIELGV
jgi:hypothetical protein